MTGAHYNYNNAYERVPTAYSAQAGFGTNDLGDYSSYNGSLQRSQSRISDETASYGSQGYPMSPGTSLDSYDYNVDPGQYAYRQAPHRSTAATGSSYTPSYRDGSVPRYREAYDYQNTLVEPISPQSSSQPEYICLYEGCRQKPFKRSADLARHLKHVHKRSNETYFCDYNRCQRSERGSAAAATTPSSPSDSNSAIGTGPFGRKDHCRDHYRTYHKEDLCRRNGKEEAGWFDDRNINLTWWRCTKCLKRVSYRECGWQCADCEQMLEPERINTREMKMGMRGSSRGH